MKNLSIIAVIGLGVCLQAGATSLTTTDGTTYNDISSQRIDPDGLYIEYNLPGGGMGMSKVKFSRLSEDQQKQYNYSATNAAAYSAAVAKANEDFRQESIRFDQLAAAQRATRQAQEAEMEKVMTDRMIAMAQIKQQQQNTPPVSDFGGYGYGSDFVGIPAVGSNFHNKNTPVRQRPYNPFARLNRQLAKP